MTVLYIVFLGIVPTISFISIGVWYRKNNSSRPGWKKDMLSPYVSNLPCFRNNKPKNLSPSIKKLSKNKFSLPTNKNKFISIFKLSRDKNTANNSSSNDNNLMHGHENNKIFTINTLSRDKINIQRKNLVSTTNQDVINCSNNINARNSLLFSDNANSNDTAIYANVSNFINRDNPAVSIHSSHCDKVNDKNKREKNFKDLKLNTRINFKQLDESPSSSDSAGVLLENGVKINEPLPFYNKKPPPPPAPPANNKPKLFK